MLHGTFAQKQCSPCRMEMSTHTPRTGRSAAPHCISVLSLGTCTARTASTAYSPPWATLHTKVACPHPKVDIMDVENALLSAHGTHCYMIAQPPPFFE